MTITLSELEKNIEIIRDLKEDLYVYDTDTNEFLATIIPYVKELDEGNKKVYKNLKCS